MSSVQHGQDCLLIPPGHCRFGLLSLARSESEDRTLIMKNHPHKSLPSLTRERVFARKDLPNLGPVSYPEGTCGTHRKLSCETPRQGYGSRGVRNLLMASASSSVQWGQQPSHQAQPSACYFARWHEAAAVSIGISVSVCTF